MVSARILIVDDVLSSHILSEIQQVTDRIGIIHDGHLVAEHDTAGHPAQELEDYFLSRKPE